MSGSTDEPPPRRLRTWWHPLLVQQLRWLAGPVYEVRDEVPVGQLPLRLDILLLRQREGQLSPHHQQALAGLVEYWKRHTIIDFKGPTDQFAAGDFRTLLAYVHLYCVQTDPLLAPNEVSLLVIAPRLTEPYRDELTCCGATVEQIAPGMHRVVGAAGHPMWLIETEFVAGAEHPLLTLVSPAFLRERARLIEALRQAGHGDLVMAMVQQIAQFRRSGADFAQHHRGTEVMMPSEVEMLSEILHDLPVEERLLVLRGLPAEDRQQFLRGLPLEERLAGLSPQELARLRNLLPPSPPNQDP